MNTQIKDDRRWFSRLLSFFDDRERIHREIGELIARVKQAEAQSEKAEIKIKQLEAYATEMSEWAQIARKESAELRNLVKDERQAQDLVSAVATIKALIR